MGANQDPQRKAREAREAIFQQAAADPALNAIYQARRAYGSTWRPGEIWVWLELNAGWVAYYRVVDQEGELVIAEIRVLRRPGSSDEEFWIERSLDDPSESRKVRVRDDGTVVEPREPPIPPGGLSARLIRSAGRVGQALALARHTGKLANTVLFEAPVLSEEALRAPRRVGRRGRSDRYYAELAAMYLAAIESDSRAPVAAVAEQLGPGHTPVYVRDALNRARDRDLLTRPSSRGRPGGKLTDKARAALGQTKEEDS